MISFTVFHKGESAAVDPDLAVLSAYDVRRCHDAAHTVCAHVPAMDAISRLRTVDLGS